MPTTYAIPNGRTVMDATTYTGTGAVQPITNNDLGTNGFKPDLVWLKSRSRVGSSHYLFDSVRGINNFISSDSTAAASTVANTLTSFDTSGFTLGSIGGDINANGSTFVGWQWQAGQGTTSSNTNGSITSTVSVNSTAGFSIVTYTGTGSAATVGHGLGVAPSFIIVKARSSAYNWAVYTSAYGKNYALELQSTAAIQLVSDFWGSGGVTSSVFGLNTYNSQNASGTTYVAYCWAQIAGFSQFGSYTGNGSTDGPFIYTGFRPKYIMIKLTSGAGYEWYVYDTARETYNVAQTPLFPNQSSAVSANSAFNIDLLSNGFKCRSTYLGNNGNGSSYIYAAFAENPFKYANAR